MPQLIERGYLYIAQPPLFRAKRGQSATYLKDERAMQDYLLEMANKDLSLTSADGRQMQGAELEALLHQARLQSQLCLGLAGRFGGAEVVSHAVIAGLLDGTATAAPVTADAGENEPAGAPRVAFADAAVQAFEQRLNQHHARKNQRWVAVVEGDETLLSPEAYRLGQAAVEMRQVYHQPLTLRLGEAAESVVSTPQALFQAALDAGRKGLSFQRYKGLGEMNPDQLWETTLDPIKRTLLQVKLQHLDEAEQVFSTLMGDVVEPRRDFIQANAHKVGNLDV
jgi:DNA gyrase subunit B